MKKIGIVITSILVFSSLQIVLMPTFETDAATPTLKVTIASPSNKTYNSRFLTLYVTVYWLAARIDLMYYSVDGQENCFFSAKNPDSTGLTVIREAALPELSEGPHEITVCVIGTVDFFSHIRDKATTYFTIDATPPSISSLSIQNETYTQLSLPLNFSVNESTSWMGYSVDNEANRTLTGNTTLTANLGRHSLVLYANDTAGNMGASPTTIFSIVEPFPTTLVVASTITVTVICISLLVFFRKHKH
jgi:hypothetical protein